MYNSTSTYNITTISYSDEGVAVQLNIPSIRPTAQMLNKWHLCLFSAQQIYYITNKGQKNYHKKMKRKKPANEKVSWDYKEKTNSNDRKRHYGKQWWHWTFRMAWERRAFCEWGTSETEAGNFPTHYGKLWVTELDWSATCSVLSGKGEERWREWQVLQVESLVATCPNMSCYSKPLLENNE